MKVWLKQRHNKFLDSYRFGHASFSAQRAIVVCPDSENLLIDCSRAFFEQELANGRIVADNPGEWARQIVAAMEKAG